ncbi:GDCCVxC domain-containing (seleno)protein [Shewanella sp. Isolate7]|uniref:GDCCVxC domain-containing (seleno)protein n=1 Tax=Shewanella sp. Isolate7 TaxID=2908528 RepID=UPI001EFE37D2|nr:GDCCVxC domain-containing (seleno)protein [Shewanella sp. Isolate7]MCG9721453.1 hypothetical protein [Shewanella sp. Isolate7]
MVSDLVLTSEITCPHCGHIRQETMPTNACQFFYECQGCHKLLKPLPGDCCVFCSYGTVKCPQCNSGSVHSSGFDSSDSSRHSTEGMPRPAEVE